MPVQAKALRAVHWHCNGRGCHRCDPVRSFHPPAGWVSLLLNDGAGAKFARVFCSKACLVDWTHHVLRGVQDDPVVPVHEGAAS